MIRLTLTIAFPIFFCVILNQHKSHFQPTEFSHLGVQLQTFLHFIQKGEFLLTLHWCWTGISWYLIHPLKQVLTHIAMKKLHLQHFKYIFWDFFYFLRNETTLQAPNVYKLLIRCPEIFLAIDNCTLIFEHLFSFTIYWCSWWVLVMIFSSFIL